MIKNLPLVIILGFYVLIFTEGCGRTPSQPSPPVTTPGPSENSTIPENHRLSCTENETFQTACLNGGSCFATYVEYRTIQCACPKKYVGDRCQMIDPTIIFGRENEEKVTKAGLAAGLTALILFLTVLIFILIWHRRYKRRKDREKQNKEEQRIQYNNGDLNNGNYKPALTSRNRDNYVESIPLTSLPYNQREEEIHKEEEKPLQSSQNSSFSDSDSRKLLASIKFMDDDDSGASPEFV
ncbi:uncharacterized protein [Mytilus edulis]|uniref:uncharacterized protein n=1 Tax=Mytilus edulis TaxID=6550 RepID=UPI0039EE5CB5